MKKYGYTLTTRLPEVLANSMKGICEELGVNESDLVRKSIATEIQRLEASGSVSKFEYIWLLDYLIFGKYFFATMIERIPPITLEYTIHGFM